MSRARHFDRDSTYNIPCVPIPPQALTAWDVALAELRATEEQALKAIRKPHTPEEMKLRRTLEKKVRGMRDRKYIPSVAIDAFGWREQQEQKFSC